MVRTFVGGALICATTVSADGDGAARGDRETGQHQDRHRAELSADGVPRSRHQRAVRFRHRARRGARPQAWCQGRMAGDELRSVYAVDRDGAGGCHPVRDDRLCEPAGNGDVCRLSAQRSAFLRAAIPRGRVQGRSRALRQEGRGQPAHHVPGSGRRVERGALRQQSDPVRRHGGSADARTQLKQGRIDAAVQGSETLPYIMDLEPAAYTPVGETIASQFTGIALPVKEKAFQQAMVEARRRAGRGRHLS